jgi:hypothetical protein
VLRAPVSSLVSYAGSTTALHVHGLVSLVSRGRQPDLQYDSGARRDCHITCAAIARPFAPNSRRILGFRSLLYGHYPLSLSIVKARA